ncbi:enolase C-terminal domain-like protein [Candidatus Thalassolituus haligoni]|uniref:enolase C-terminal domain-like protein n=1 Tax=Candidatus Thalassolituus haligoni TaxID=3100113 RepID=UPI0035138618
MKDFLIKGIKARGVNAPLKYPVYTAMGAVETSPLVLIDVLTTTDEVGHAYIFGYTPLTIKPLISIIMGMESALIGLPVAPQSIEKILSEKFTLLGFTGLVRMACSGIDMALWDLLSKQAGLPLYKYLGGIAQPIKSYDSHSMDGRNLAAERAAGAASSGFKGIKTKIGYSSVQEDINVIRGIRKEVGDNFSIMVDFNQSLTVPQAIARGQALQDEGIAWIEEPTLQYDYDGHKRIRESLNVPIQMGENWIGPEEMMNACMAGASDLAMPDIMKIGGVTGWLRASALAQQFSLPMSSHLFQEFSAHLLTVTPTADWLEKLDIAESVVDSSLKFVDGNVIISDEPGAGITWKESEIVKYII